MKLSFQNLLLVALGLGVLGLLVWAFLPAPVDVDLGQVTRGRLRVTVDEDGKTRIRDRYTVSAPLTGRLLRLGLKAGDAIVTGKTVLASIEPRDPELLDASARTASEARVKASEAAKSQALPNLERARANHEFAIADLDRFRKLYTTRSASQQEYDGAIQKERAAAEELKAARFGAQIAEYELEVAKAALVRTRVASPGENGANRFDLPAPIDGRVLRVFQESATVVTPGSRLLEVGDPADLEVEIDVLSADAVKIRPGAEVELEHWGGDASLRGRVRLIEPAAFTKVSALGVEEQRVWVVVDFVDPPANRPTLGDAYRVEARIVIWDGTNVLKVPAGALFRHDDGWAVFGIATGKAVVRPVQVGRSNGLETEITGGLDEGDAVVLYPSDRIRAGVAVMAR